MHLANGNLEICADYGFLLGPVGPCVRLAQLQLQVLPVHLLELDHHVIGPFAHHAEHGARHAYHHEQNHH